MSGRRRFVPLLAGLVLLFVVLTAVTQTGTTDPVMHRYGDHPRQILAAYWHAPEGGATQPGLVMVHGGHWDKGGPAELTEAAEWYAARGFAVFSVGHRSTADTVWPGPRDDVIRAIEWIKANAHRFHLDPDRIAVLGAESGGHLAVQAGTLGAGGARVRGVVGLSAVASPARAYAEALTTPTAATAATRAGRRALRDGTVLLARCTPAAAEPACAARFADMGVAAHADVSDAPMLLLHSAADVVPVSHAQDAHAALTRAGMPDVTVRTVRGGRTGAALLGDEAVRHEILGWLKTRTAPAAAEAGTGQRRSAGSEPSGAPPTSVPPAASPLGLPASGTNGRHEVTRSYGPDPRHAIDVFFHPPRPAEPRSGGSGGSGGAVEAGGRVVPVPRPALLLVHGGGWLHGDKVGWTSTARRFADEGFIVFAMNYRLTTTDRWPAPRADVLRALAWIRQNATAYNADPDRVALVGSSAGGQLAIAAGTYGVGGEKVKAIVALSPVVRPLSAYEAGDKATATATVGERRLRDYSLLLARCTPVREATACWKRWHDLDGLSRVSAGDPPVYTVHSQGDPVPAAHSAQLCHRLRAVKVGCTEVVLPGSGHSIELLKVPGVRVAITAWLRAHL